MKIKDNKGSITVFVLVGLLFMSAFLIISYANNVNKSKIAKEQFNIISSTYSRNDGDENAYKRAYTAIRKKNAQTLTESSENSSTLELTKTFTDNMSDYKIYGNSVQNGTPSPTSPVEIQSVGDKTKNLVDYTKAVPRNSSQTVIIDEQNNCVIWTGDYYFEIPVNISSGETISLSSESANKGSWTVLYEDNTYSSSIAQGKSITTEKNVVAIRIYKSNATVSESDMVFKNIMLEYSTTSTEYEPYGYKIPVKVSGKNLVNEDNFSHTSIESSITEEQEYYNVSTDTNTAGIRWDLDETFSVGDKITFQAKVKYISAADDEEDSVTLRIWNVTKSDWIHTGANGKETAYSTITKGVDKYLTVTTTLTETNYTSGDIIQVRVTRGIKNISKNLINFYVYKNSVMVQKNDTEVKYEPYVEPQIVNIYLDEPLRKAGNCVDYIDFKSGQVKRNVAKYYVTGNELWGTSGESSVDYFHCTPSLGANISERANTLSNMFVYNVAGVPQCFWIDSTGLELRIKNDNYSDVTEFNSWLESAGMYLIYPTKDEKTEQINLLELKTYEDYTKIDVLTEISPSKIEATYYGYTME